MEYGKKVKFGESVSKRLSIKNSMKPSNLQVLLPRKLKAKSNSLNSKAQEVCQECFKKK